MVDAKLLKKPIYSVQTTSTHFYLQKEGSEYTAIIDRDSRELKLEKKISNAPGKLTECYGIFGIASFLASKYLLVITEALFVGKIRDSFIYRVESVEFLPYEQPALLSQNKSKKSDDYFISLYTELIDTKTFYFSYDYDLTHTLQNIVAFTPEQQRMQIWERCNYNYFWNSYLSEELMEALAHDWILPIINGYVQIEYIQMNSAGIDYALISRRDHRRTGTRFHTRGLDDKGHAVNFVETEQIVLYPQSNKWVISSYVQLRGSIPLLWEQKPNLSYNPRMKVTGSTQQNSDAARLHFAELKAHYEEIVVVNLIDKKGNQKELGIVFTDLIDTLKDESLNYVWFDFHDECKKMQWHNLSKLLNLLQEYMEKHNYFQIVIDNNSTWSEAEVQLKQTGVLRSNCIDCLDRTNVVQSVFARKLLLKTLHSLRLTSPPSGEAFQRLPEPLETCFRNFWVNNADFMSILYAGTPALKTDFTRTGRRSKRGAIMDGVNSTQRYFLNNFFDGRRQDAMDAMLGKISPKQDKVSCKNKYSPLLLGISSMIFLIFISHYCAETTGEGYGYWAVLFISLGILLRVLKRYGRNIADKPFNS